MSDTLIDTGIRVMIQYHMKIQTMTINNSSTDEQLVNNDWTLHELLIYERKIIVTITNVKQFKIEDMIICLYRMEKRIYEIDDEFVNIMVALLYMYRFAKLTLTEVTFNKYMIDMM